MKHDLLSRTIAVAILALVSLSASSQTKIENLIQGMLNSKSNEVTYQERRDPKTRQITSSSYVIVSKDRALYDKVFDAIQQERPQSVKYSQVGNEVISITFYNQGSRISVSLVDENKNKSGSWVLNFSKKPDNSSDKGEYGLISDKGEYGLIDHNISEDNLHVYVYGTTDE